MANEKLQTKLIEIRVRKFASALSGAVEVEVISLMKQDFLPHQRTVADFCGIDCVPQHKWTHPVDEDEVLGFLCSRISKLSTAVHIPCERPFTIKANINDCFAFIRSIWKAEGTKDLTLYLTSPAKVMQLQDLEYELAYFEVEPRLPADA